MLRTMPFPSKYFFQHYSNSLSMVSFHDKPEDGDREISSFLYHHFLLLDDQPLLTIGSMTMSQ